MATGIKSGGNIGETCLWWVLIIFRPFPGNPWLIAPLSSYWNLFTIFPKFRTNHIAMAQHNPHFHPIHQRIIWNETSFNVPELFCCESWIKQIRNYSGLTLIPPPVSFPFKWPLFGIRGAAYPSHRCHQHVLPPLVNRQQCNCHLVSRFKVALAFRFLFSLSSSSSFHNPHNPAQRGPCWLCLCCA